MIVTTDGRQLSTRSKILAFHSSLLAKLLEKTTFGEKTTISVDSTTEEVSSLLSLISTGESRVETGSMLGEVCRLAKSLGIQVHSLNVLNCNSWDDDLSYSLQDTSCDKEDNSKELEEAGENEENIVALRETKSQGNVMNKSLPLSMNRLSIGQDYKFTLEKNQTKSVAELGTVKELTECHFCPKTFKSKSKLKIHAMCHTGYSCNFCHKGFRFTSLLKSHITNTHKELMQYLCTRCNVLFSSTNDLKEHIKCNHFEDSSPSSYNPVMLNKSVLV